MYVHVYIYINMYTYIYIYIYTCVIDTYILPYKYTYLLHQRMRQVAESHLYPDWIQSILDAWPQDADFGRTRPRRG